MEIGLLTLKICNLVLQLSVLILLVQVTLLHVFFGLEDLLS